MRVLAEIIGGSCAQARAAFLFMAQIEFKATGYLEKSYLDKDGGKHITFELSAKAALQVARLELMGRDLINHLPVLLEIRVKQSLREGLQNNAGPKQRSQVVR